MVSGAADYLCNVIYDCAFCIPALSEKYDQRRLGRQRAQLAKLKQITATSIEWIMNSLLKNIHRSDADVQGRFSGRYWLYCCIFLWKTHDTYRLISSRPKGLIYMLKQWFLKNRCHPELVYEKAPYFVKHSKLWPEISWNNKVWRPWLLPSKQTDKGWLMP